LGGSSIPSHVGGRPAVILGTIPEKRILANMGGAPVGGLLLGGIFMALGFLLLRRK